MTTTTVDNIDKLFYSFIKDEVIAWAKNNAKLDEIVESEVKRGFTEGQAIYQEILSHGFHEVEIAEDGMSAIYKKRRSYLFFGVVLDKDLNIEVSFPERIVPALPLKYNRDTHFTTVHEATMIRKRIIATLSEPI